MKKLLKLWIPKYTKWPTSHWSLALPFIHMSYEPYRKTIWVMRRPMGRWGLPANKYWSLHIRWF